MKQVPLSEVKDDLSRYVRLAAQEEVFITRHGKPATVLVGFESEEDWFDYRLENAPGFWIALRPYERVCALVRALVLKTLVKRDN